MIPWSEVRSRVDTLVEALSRFVLSQQTCRYGLSKGQSGTGGGGLTELTGLDVLFQYP